MDSFIPVGKNATSGNDVSRMDWGCRLEDQTVDLLGG